MHFPKGGHLIGGELYYQLEVNNNLPQGVSEDEALVQESKLTFLALKLSALQTSHSSYFNLVNSQLLLLHF